jgi:serine/threonine-protein kinase RsbW
MAGEYRLDGLAVPETRGELHDLLARVAAEHPDVAGEDLQLFETAVIEIAGNVVEHGRPEGQVTYAFTLRVLDDRLSATLEDSGQEEPPPPEADMPSVWAEEGRGLALAGAVLDELDVERRDGWNHWQLTRMRRPEDGASDAGGPGPQGDPAP